MKASVLQNLRRVLSLYVVDMWLSALDKLHEITYLWDKPHHLLWQWQSIKLQALITNKNKTLTTYEDEISLPNLRQTFWREWTTILAPGTTSSFLLLILSFAKRSSSISISLFSLTENFSLCYESELHKVKVKISWWLYMFQWCLGGRFEPFHCYDKYFCHWIRWIQWKHLGKTQILNCTSHFAPYFYQ